MPITCRHCGYSYNAESNSACDVCRRPLVVQQSTRASAMDNFVVEGAANRPPSTESSGQATLFPEHSAIEACQAEPGGIHAADQGTVLDGRISHVERHDERPPTGFYAIAGRLMLYLLLALPFMALFLTTAAVYIAFAIIGFATISELFNPFTWLRMILDILEVWVIGRIRGTDTIPVYRGMVENRWGQEQYFMLRGPLNLGNLVVGHHVQLRGSWLAGTFMVSRGYDVTTQSTISSRFRNGWKVVFYLMLIVYGALGLAVLNHPAMLH